MSQGSSAYKLTTLEMVKEVVLIAMAVLITRPETRTWDSLNQGGL